MGRKAGVTEGQLADMASYATSDAFNNTEKLVLEYAEAMTRTPVEVGDDLYARLAERFSNAELVELTAEIAWENWRARFNHAFGMESQGFSEGAYCALPE